MILGFFVFMWIFGGQGSTFVLLAADNENLKGMYGMRINEFSATIEI